MTSIPRPNPISNGGDNNDRTYLEPATINTTINTAPASSIPTAPGRFNAQLSSPLMHTIGTLAHRLFNSKTPPAQAARITTQLKALIRQVTPAHLALSPMQSPVEYYPIYESEVFTMCVFVLKKGVTMPTHDHPNMMVFSRIVLGDLWVKTYEFIDDRLPPGSINSSKLRGQ
ncbi:hypothetical protein HK102_009490, partial [Quaeritorhiza haematococci]